MNDTAHMVPYGEMANADICGARYSRYRTLSTRSPWSRSPYLTGDHPDAGDAGHAEPQCDDADPAVDGPRLSDARIAVPVAGCRLGSSRSAERLPQHPAHRLDAYSYRDHRGPRQAPDLLEHRWRRFPLAADWPRRQRRSVSGGANEGHASALTVLTSQAFWGFLPEASKQECLECHSADFRIMKEAGKTVTSADVKYGITCVGCHTPHENGSAAGAWNGEFDDQVRVDPANGSATNGSNLCVECHNGEIPAGSTASPGAEVHHPMKEMMDGYGAIDVASFPSVHKGKCVQCHMPPTSISRGSVQLGGNHTFNIITPAKRPPTRHRSRTPPPPRSQR